MDCKCGYQMDRIKRDGWQRLLTPSSKRYACAACHTKKFVLFPREDRATAKTGNDRKSLRS